MAIRAGTAGFIHFKQSKAMQQYNELIQRILNKGVRKTDRTGTGTLSVFGHQMRFDLNEGFPLLTTRKISFKAVAYELLWFLKAGDNIKYLNDNSVKIWDAWSDDNGYVGRIYGVQWRQWDSVFYIDQLANAIHEIRTNPDSRRLLVSAWNPAEIDCMALPPCHYAFQFYVENGKLSCMFNMRSSDVFIGLPYNIASYALLTHMIAKICGIGVGEVIYSGGDCHIYLNHLDQVNELLTREHKPLPTLKLNYDSEKFGYGVACDIDRFEYSDIKLIGYNPHPHIPAPIAV